MRAAAKNHDRVTIVSDPADYSQLIAELKANDDLQTSLAFRRRMAIKVGLRIIYFILCEAISYLVKIQISM